MISPKSIGYFHDPSITKGFQKQVIFDNDLILFSVASEAPGRVSLDCISVIGGRSSSGIAIPGKKFTDIIDLPASERDLFIHSLYKSIEKAVILPLKDKILVIYNQLLRSNGLGVALIFDYSPRCLSALIKEGLLNFDSVLVSPIFSNLSEKVGRSMEFLGSLSRILDSFKIADTLSRFEPRGDIKTIFSIINSASDVMGCPISVDLGDGSDASIFLDRPTLMSFALCMLSEARRLSKDRRSSIRLSFNEFVSISVGFELYSKSNIENSIFESDFCDKMALEMGIPFGIEISKNQFKASFIPYRADPSVLGFKAGIFIDGKRITRLP